MRFPKYLRPWICCLLSMQLAAAQVGLAQDNTATAQNSSTPDKPPLTQAQLEQMVAPIALYPDPLLSQILMASTYPLEIVQADRWVKENKNLTGDALAAALEKQTWDPSVKSLVNFPDVLSMMSDKLDLTVKLGDAMLDQQQDLMNTVQNLRAKAQAQGNLQSNQQQIVNVQAAPPAPAPAESTVVVQQVPAPTQIIEIQPAQPDVIYVPSYSPTVVYGAWPYPAYPPYPYYPPGYVAPNLMSFGAGVACGLAWGYAWGNCNWGHGDIDVDVNRNNNFNRNIDRSKYNGGRNGGRNGVGNGGGNGRWQHNPSHRGGVPYANQRDAQRFGGANQGRNAAQAREQFRGRTNSGFNSPSASQRPANGNGFGNGAIQNRGNSASQLPSRNGAGNNSLGNRGNSASQLPTRNQGGATAGRNQPSAVAGNRGGGGASVSNRQSSGGGAFGGSSSSGRATRAASQRGSSSRGASRSGGSRGGGARGGGGRRR